MAYLAEQLSKRGGNGFGGRQKPIQVQLPGEAILLGLDIQTFWSAGRVTNAGSNPIG